MLEYIKYRQWQLDRKTQRAAELEANKEATRVANMEAEARKQEEIAARKKLLLEQQEAERLRQKRIQREEKLAEQKWDKQIDTLLTQIKDRLQKDDKLEEMRIIIHNREPSLQELDWANWLSNPLNQKLAELDFDHAMEMFKRDNLMAKRRHGTRGKKIYSPANYVLSFTGNSEADASEDYVSTTFDPYDYNLHDGFTISYWVRPDELGATMFVIGRKPDNNDRFQFGINTSDNFFVGVGRDRSRSTAHGMSAGIWYHWVITYAGHDNGRELLVYRDGTELLSTTFTWSQTGTTTDATVYFGGYNSHSTSGYTAGWACGLDEVAIFDEVKDSDWVTSVYNTNRPRGPRRAQLPVLDLSNDSGLVGYWKFEDGSGTTVTDYSGNGNHGTFAAISGDTTAYPTWEIS